MSNEKQKTAVDWFLDQLIEHRIIIVDKTTYQVKYKHQILLEQAKEMEKEIVLSFKNEYDEQQIDALNNNTIIYTEDEYYDITYRDNK
jgi:ribosomal 30S subunit maturation factor RimM